VIGGPASTTAKRSASAIRITPWATEDLGWGADWSGRQTDGFSTES
jgi:hypothetical protein